MEKSKNCQLSNNLGYKIKPGKRPYIVFFLLFFPIFCLYFYIFIIVDLSSLKGLGFVAVIILFFYIWVYSQTVELFPDRMTYHFWFFNKRTILLKDIDKWSYQIGVIKYSDRFKPTVRLEIYPAKGKGFKPIIIPIKLFNKKSVNQILKWLPTDKRM